MPVNASNWSVSRVAAAYLEQHSNRKRRIGLVAEKIGIGALNVAHELFGPMTFFASLLGRPQILNRGRNGPGILLGHRGVDLVGAREFGADIPGGALADITFGASYPRMRRVTVGDE